jgi:thiol-disulfide isomerase/thioredoxin
VQDEADQLKKAKAAIMTKMKPLQEAYNKANTEYSNALKAKKDEATLASLKDAANNARDAMDPLRGELSKMDLAFMDKNPSSYVTASMLRYMVGRMSVKEGEQRYNNLSEEVKKTSLGKSIKQDIDELRAGSPGAKAFSFASNEIKGGELKLEDYRGKYVLIDFWASWCVPCRKGNPHLLSLYAKYKGKGLEIIGVSDDDSNPEAWKKAVEQDKIGVWKHVLRGLKRVDGPEMFDRSNSIADRYGISSLPTKILVDPNGIIIGRYGGGGENDKAMDEKLSEIFGG